ncbi:hypothetical protein Cs7R123_33060 [Catellatospora sp. TT07R-123]|uniref:DUF6807 domain-containing protein n=1 Tax=Catellatospora sp. TT07R-123 TaxID=2733863 RepID=UPI001B23CC26|nr:PmoA family protein [Catellatospora sp. TT07R-123]GHJ45964.1 hypothetical protein Cs7R123_33060 [Catellatospora sp. TT07R-123]
MSDAALRLTDDRTGSLAVEYGDQLLLRYVYQPTDPQLESPRPYFHPLHTLGGDLVSLFRPHDHVWHRGIALSLPNVGTENFWGGVTYTRGHEYRQLPNNGSMRHQRFDRLDAEPGLVRVAHRLDWITEGGETWLREERGFTVTAAPDSDAWVLTFTTALTNVSGRDIVMGSPTTEGRDNAGYGGLFWRGPRSFTGGAVHVEGRTGGDELMGVRAPWLGFTGRHDGSSRSSTLVFVDDPGNGDQHVKWFVRAEPFACVCPAPFFDEEVTMAHDGSLLLRYAVVVADGSPDPAALAALGTATLTTLATPED